MEQLLLLVVGLVHKMLRVILVCQRERLCMRHYDVRIGSPNELPDIDLSRDTASFLSVGQEVHTIVGLALVKGGAIVVIMSLCSTSRAALKEATVV